MRPFSIHRAAAALLAAGLLAVPTVAGAAPTPEQKRAAEAVRSACTSDYRKFCLGVQPGGGRVLACFEAHAAEVSTPCRDALKEARALRGANTPAPSR